MASYIAPSEVISPKAHWHLFDVVLDRGEGEGAYALGTWDGARRIGFRWNGSAEAGRIGNPQSRGLPTWTMLDPALHEGVVDLLPPEKQVLAKRFLGLRAPAEWQSILADIRTYHREQVQKIASAITPVEMLDGGHLVLHVVPFSAVDARQSLSSDDIFRKPDKFPPMGNVRPTDSKIDHEGLVTGSNAEGLRHAQRAYVHVSRTGIVESVVSSLARGAASKFIELPRISDYIVKYAQLYAASLNSCGIAAPVAIVASLVGVKDMRLVQDFIANVIAEDLPFGALHEDSIHFGEVIFETVPAEYNESAKTLRPLLNHLANAAALPSSPYFDADGNYTLKVRQGL